MLILGYIYTYMSIYTRVYIQFNECLQLYEFFMNLNRSRPKSETEGFLLSINKNCETLIEQTHRKAEETLEFKMTKPRETFTFNTPIQVKGD